MNSTVHPDAVLSARAVARGSRQSSGRSASRGLLVLVLAACIGGAAFALNSPQGVAARQSIAPRLPSYISTSWMSAPMSQSPAQQGSSSVRLATADATPLQPTPVAQDVSSAAIPAPPSAELMQTLQTMAHDIATVEQGIEQLKASQAQIAADNARVIEQLNANQEQLRLAVRSSDKPSGKPAAPETRAKPLSSQPGAPRPVASAALKPPSAPPSRAKPRAQPVQLQPGSQ